jgi:hypothetical protein
VIGCGWRGSSFLPHAILHTGPEVIPRHDQGKVREISRATEMWLVHGILLYDIHFETWVNSGLADQSIKLDLAV